MERERALHHVELTTTERVIGQYAQLFVQRWDTYTRQRDRSRSYYRVRDRAGRPIPLTPAEVGRHLRGEITIGLYSVDPHGLTKWNVLDSDEGVEPLTSTQGALARSGIASYLETSRKGGHLWIFWQEPVRPDTARKILSPYAGSMEVFPAGDIPDEDGLGLCIRAPLGIHRLSMHRYPFVTSDGERLVPGSAVRGQIEWLHQHATRNDPDPHIASVEKQAEVPPMLLERSRSDAGNLIYESPIQRWVDSANVMAVIGEHVSLSRGGMGHCPWGDRHKNGDRHKSLKVYASTGRWWCFSERVGGNAFDFLARYHALSPKELLARLDQTSPRVPVHRPSPASIRNRESSGPRRAESRP
jgi:CHC2 zinc finger